MKDRFSKIILGAMLIFLLVCIIRFVQIKFSYEIINFLDKRKIITLSPRLVARQYVLALKRKDYRVAYDYLLPASQEKFPFLEFVALNEKGMTELDEKTTWIEGVWVGMQIHQDPGSWGFLMVKVNGRWRIVMNGGSPSFPYAFECNGLFGLKQHIEQK